MTPSGPDLRLILAVRSAGLPPALARGFSPMGAGKAIGILEAAGPWLGPRTALEGWEDFRQVIPYVVLRSGPRVVSYRRTAAGGEARLHGRSSIGLGGHVDLADVAVTPGGGIDVPATLGRAADREILEELGPVRALRKAWVGLLVEDGSPVDRVHIGAVALWDVDALPGRAAEAAIGEVALRAPSELRDAAADLERWSERLLPWLASGPP